MSVLPFEAASSDVHKTVFHRPALNCTALTGGV
jgi:hypothetical protein